MKQIRIQDTKTWKSLDTFNKVWVYESMTPTFEEKVFHALLWINPIGFGIMLADKLRYRKTINQIKLESSLLGTREKQNDKK